MKNRTLTIFITLLLSLSLAACTVPVMEPDQPLAEQDSSLDIVNPVKEMSRQELIEETGIDLGEPEGAEDMVYSLITLSEGSPIVQLHFTLDGSRLCLRAQSVLGQNAKDISGLYYEWENSGVVYISNCPGRVFCSGDVGYIKWIDAAPGIQYSLSMTEGADTKKLEEHARAVFKPVQGDVG